MGEDILRLELVVELLGYLVTNFLVCFAEEIVLFAWELEVALLVAKVGESLRCDDGGLWVRLLGYQGQHFPIVRYVMLFAPSYLVPALQENVVSGPKSAYGQVPMLSICVSHS